MISAIIENLEYRLSVLYDEFARISERCRSNLVMGKAAEKKHLMQLSQIRIEIQIIKQEISNQSQSGVSKYDTTRIRR